MKYGGKQLVLNQFLISCRKINHHHKNTFTMCKELNGTVLKSVNLLAVRAEIGRKLAEPGKYFVSCFVPGWDWSEFLFSLSGRSGQGENSYLYLELGRAEISDLRAGP